MAPSSGSVRIREDDRSWEQRHPRPEAGRRLTAFRRRAEVPVDGGPGRAGDPFTDAGAAPFAGSSAGPDPQRVGEPAPRGPGEPGAEPARRPSIPSLRSDVDRIEPPWWQVAQRTARVLGAGLFFFVANLFERAFRGWSGAWKEQGYRARDEWLVDRQARRLRRILQNLGGTMVKVGQQLSIRADLLPPAYCRELDSLLDQAGAIEIDHVRSVIEEVTGLLPEDLFASIDPHPIGQASVSCVYRAVLHDGARVAVKIRRPGIIRSFKADLGGLDFLSRLAEGATILRPGISQSLRKELRQLLLEELDFRTEARYQELFQVYVERWSALHTSAPAVYPRLCGEAMMVSELVEDALSVKQIQNILDSGDAEGLALLDEMEICPEKVARRLVRSSHYQFFDCPFFHGDPHPANILVRSGSRIVLIDFGACGVFAEGQRNHLRRMNYAQSRSDIGGMVQSVIHLMEPLPPIDLTDFRRDLEAAWWHGFYAIESRYSEWWERTSFRLWTALLATVRKYGIPLPLSVLRMIRATLLYDTVAARLFSRIDVFAEYRAYFQWSARRERRDAAHWLAHQAVFGPDPALFVQARRVYEVFDGFLFEAQRFLDQPRPQFLALVSKGFELLLLGLHWLLWAAIATLVGSVVMFFDAWRLASELGQWQQWRLSEVGLREMREGLSWVREVQMAHHFATPGMQLGEWALAIWVTTLFVSAVLFLRRAWFRLGDKDRS